MSRLGRERIDFLRNDREAAPGGPGAGSLDRRVERKQMCLSRDVLDALSERGDAVESVGKR